ncbi:transposable element Tcb2 transposase [Trichonephila clavipes]|uniref:Transposable element Tcb2 transposase n=1 Tax=Trichonephila clavipes TaxID=2585209 RepID=A0A8X6W874_TRICX|nr:transposable element Tcb2 transposase [Trichonephila clavipes]
MPGCRQRRHFQQTDDFTRGAARVTSAREDRRISRQAVAAPQATSTSILQHVQDTLDVLISTRTISRRLVESGLHSWRPLRTLALTPQRRRARLEWCRARATWMTEWRHVVFLYESRFRFFNDSQRIQGWRRRGERSNPAGSNCGAPYRSIMRHHGLGSYCQDNVRPYTARISQHAQRGVQMLLWPAYSPDLSPIEHVWGDIGRHLQTLPLPRTNDPLWQTVEREWRTIPQDTIRTLIDSVPRRVSSCIAATSF